MLLSGLVKKRDLLDQLREIAKSADNDFVFLREGKHEVWLVGGQRSYIPRHRDISEGVARNILKRARKTVR